MVKTETAGRSNFIKIAISKSRVNEIRKTTAVFKMPFKMPFRNKIIGRRKRKAGPAKGTKTAEKTNKKTTGSNRIKRLSPVPTMIFFEGDKLLTIEYPVQKPTFNHGYEPQGKP